MKESPFKKLTKFDYALWSSSAVILIISFLFGEQKDALTLIASLIGITALIFIAKGDVLGQILTVVFSVFYSIISLKFRYYGEMITYMGMTAPIAAMSVITWLKHPYKDGEREVKVAKMSKRNILLMLVLTVAVTIAFHFILKYFNTANLLVSTVSITTSFMASYLMLFRSPYYAVAYAANDIVLIILWLMITVENIAYLPMVICFSIFFVNDLYGFVSWQKMKKRQV